MDFYILPFLGSFEFNPWGSCTLDPRALLLVHYSTLEHKSCIWKEKGGNSETRLGGGRARRGKEVLRMADRDGAVRNKQSKEGEERTETGRLRAPGATLISGETHGPGGSGWRNTRPLPAASSDAKAGGGRRAGERNWQPRGGERGGRCGWAPGWGVTHRRPGRYTAAMAPGRELQDGPDNGAEPGRYGRKGRWERGETRGKE